MIFVATLSHRPAACWVRPENHEKAAVLLERVQFAERDFNITPLGSYLAANEHTLVLVFDAESLDAATQWLGPPILQDHDASITPVMELETALSAMGQTLSTQLSEADSGGLETEKSV